MTLLKVSTKKLASLHWKQCYLKITEISPSGLFFLDQHGPIERCDWRMRKGRERWSDQLPLPWRRSRSSHGGPRHQRDAGNTPRRGTPSVPWRCGAAVPVHKFLLVVYHFLNHCHTAVRYLQEYYITVLIGKGRN